MKPMIAYQNKTPRLISFINNYYNRKGSFKIMHKYIKIFDFIILIIILIVLLNYIIYLKIDRIINNIRLIIC